MILFYNYHKSIVTAVIKNKRVIRLNIITYNTTDEDAAQTAEKLNEIALEVKKEFAYND